MESRLAMGDQSLNQTIKDDNNIDLMSLLKDDSPIQDIVVEKKYDGKAKIFG